MFAWDVKGYGIILQLFAGYTLWAENYIYESELETIYNIRLEMCSERLALKDETIHILSNDRDYVYGLFEEQEQEAISTERRQKLKTFFIAGGSLIVGVAGGLIIGFFAAK